MATLSTTTKEKREALGKSILKMTATIVRGLLLLMASARASGCRHVDHVVQCFRPVLQETEKSVEINEMRLMAGDVERVLGLCKHYFSGQGCLEENLRRCQGLDYISRENLKIYVENVVKRGVIRLCEYPTLLQKFAEHSDCFRATHNTTGACLHDSRSRFRAGSISKHTESLDELSRRHCGTIEDLMACGYKSVSRTCGHVQGVLYLGIMRRLLSKRAADACIGPEVRLRYSSYGYEHLPSFKISSGAGYAFISGQVILRLLVVLGHVIRGMDF